MRHRSKTSRRDSGHGRQRGHPDAAQSATPACSTAVELRELPSKSSVFVILILILILIFPALPRLRLRSRLGLRSERRPDFNGSRPRARAAGRVARPTHARQMQTAGSRCAGPDAATPLGLESVLWTQTQGSSALVPEKSAGQSSSNPVIPGRCKLHRPSNKDSQPPITRSW